jgi:hypothetical protein
MKTPVKILAVYLGTVAIIFAEMACVMQFALIRGVHDMEVPGRPWWLQIGIMAAIMAVFYLYPVAKVLNVIRRKQ